MKKRKEEILHNKEQSTVKYSQMILMSMTLVYLLSLPLVFMNFLHIMLLRLKIKKTVNEKQDQPPKRRPML